MNRFLLWIVLALVLVAVCVLYMSRRPSDRLNVAPDARRQIDKAEKR